MTNNNLQVSWYGTPFRYTIVHIHWTYFYLYCIWCCHGKQNEKLNQTKLGTKYRGPKNQPNLWVNVILSIRWWWWWSQLDKHAKFDFNLLGHWSNSAPLNMSFHSNMLYWFRDHWYLLVILDATWLPERHYTNTGLELPHHLPQMRQRNNLPNDTDLTYMSTTLTFNCINSEFSIISSS